MTWDPTNTPTGYSAPSTSPHAPDTPSATPGLATPSASQPHAAPPHAAPPHGTTPPTAGRGTAAPRAAMPGEPASTPIYGAPPTAPGPSALGAPAPGASAHSYAGPPGGATPAAAMPGRPDPVVGAFAAGDGRREKAKRQGAAREAQAGRREVRPGEGWRRVVGLVVVAAVTGVAGWGFHRVFPGLELARTVAPAAVVPVVVAAVTWRRPLWLALVLDLVLWFVATIPLYGGLNPALARDLVNSWQALLTTLLPAQPEPRLLILAHTLVWVAAVIGAETLTRTRTRVAAALPALAVYGVALLLGVDGDGDNLVSTGAILVLVAVLAMVRDERPPLWLLAGAPAAAVLAAAAGVVGPLLPIAAEPYNPRRNVELPPPVRVDSVSPLDRVSAWLQIPDRELFTVQADKPLNWRLAVLDHYDGVRWTSSARFQPTGGRVPEGEWTGRSATVRQTITFDGLPGTWLPAAERPVEVNGVHGLAVDPTSGALLAGTKPVRGFRYEVTSRVPQPSKADLLVAAPVDDPSLTAFPPGPQEALFRKLAQQATEGADVPIKQAYLLQNYLRANATYDVTAPPGHSLKGLEFFMETTHRGTSEQFAATYALMARTLGLPSRVVVGFRPGQPVNGVYHVKSGHVMAWAEIKFEKLGWRPFFPTPGRGGAKDDHDVVSSAIEESEELAGEFTQGTENKPKASTHPVGAQAKDSAGGPPLWLIAPAAGAAILVVYGGVALALPWRRRRRRRNVAGAEQRVLGAWQQTCDDLGLKEQKALTAEEVVARHPGDISTHLQPLADISNFVRYAPEDVATEAADEAWRRSDAVRVAVRRRTPLKHRLRRRLLLK